jgi:protein phosphatase
MSINAKGLSDVGLTRSHNEDSLHLDDERGLYLVADGMGGHGHGEVASALAVAAIVEHVQEVFEGGSGSERDRIPVVATAMSAAVRAAHRRVVSAVEDDQSLLGMGTTVVSLMMRDDVATVAYVGDSRVYLLRDGELHLVTDDHTWVNEQVKAGYLTLEQARTHPLKSVVTRAVGGDHEVEVDVVEVDVKKNDLFLLCSDGLTSMLEDDEIRDRLVGADDLEKCCQALIDDANHHGGVDNITVILLQPG